MVGPHDSVVGRASRNLALQITPEATSTSATLENLKSPVIMSSVPDEAAARVLGDGGSEINIDDFEHENGFDISEFLDAEEARHSALSTLRRDVRETMMENQATASSASASPVQTVANVDESPEDFFELSADQPMDLVSEFSGELSTTASHISEDEVPAMNPGPWPFSFDDSPDDAAPADNANFDIDMQDDNMDMDNDHSFNDLEFDDDSDDDDDIGDPNNAIDNAPNAGQAHLLHLQALRANGCLINRLDFASFRNDGLKRERRVIPANHDDHDWRDTKKFYVPDDEFMDDTVDYYANQHAKPRARDAHASRGPKHLSGQDLALALTLTAEYPTPLHTIHHEHAEGEVGGEANNQGGLSMHTESMNFHRLTISSATPSRIPPKDQQETQRPTNPGIRESHPSYPGKCCVTLHLHKLASSFAAVCSLMTETKVYGRLVHFSRLGPEYIVGLVHCDISVNQPIVSFSSGYRAVHNLPNDLVKYKAYVAAHMSRQFSGETRPSTTSDTTTVPQAKSSQLPFIGESSQGKATPGIRTPRPSHPLLTPEQYYARHQDSESSIYYIHPSLVLRKFEAHIASPLLATLLAPPLSRPQIGANGHVALAFERNLTIDQFIRQWFMRARVPRIRMPELAGLFVNLPSEAAHVLDWERPAKISRPDSSTVYDIQAIPWEAKLGVKRSNARLLRDRMYTAYQNLNPPDNDYAQTLPQREDYFRPKTMYTKYRASMAHFQLRNLMSVTASNTIQYAHKSKIYSVTPFYDQQSCVISLSTPGPSSALFDSVKISTMKAKHGITVLGGFCGEYAYRGEVSGDLVVDGQVTRDPNGITNHIDIVQQRTNYKPQAVIASNDGNIRVLDCETNTFVDKHTFAQAINCTDTSADGRLRVIIGDSPDAWVIDSNTGKPVHALLGHRDYGFACAWSPDMRHIATSNQDRTVIIWDARMWKTLQTIDSDIAGYRSIRFSPVGGGPRTLLLCEPADRISIVNAQTFETRQAYDFFGEIGGADYSPDGSRIWVANMDVKFGGFMEYDRNQWGREYGIGHTRRTTIEARGDVYHPDIPNEWLPESDLDDDERCVLSKGERGIRFQKLFNGMQYEMLNPLLG